MVPTRKRICIFILIIAVVGLLIRMLLFHVLVDTDGSHTRRIDGSPVIVTVFYEALCPDSKYFIRKELLPAYKVATPIMEIQLVPYGKAHTSTDNDGKLNFSCQHGPTECEANIYHACTVEAIKDPMKRLELVTCMIRDSNNPKEAMHKCTKEQNIDSVSVELIQKCHDSNHGAELLKLNGDATHALRPPITFIPTITLNGWLGRQASILKNLLSEVCKVAGDTPQAATICRKGQKTST